MTATARLNVYVCCGCHVVASSHEEAVGELFDDTGEEPDPNDVTLVPGATAIDICIDGDGEICTEDDDDFVDVLSLTAREWIEREAPKHTDATFILCREY